MSKLINKIKKAAGKVAHVFGYKEQSKFGKILWRVFAVSTTIVMLYIAVLFAWNTYEYVEVQIAEMEENSSTYCHEYDNQYVSPYVIYHDDIKGGYLYNIQKGERTLTGINWICKSSDGDSLAFFSSNNKRGYFNRFTGELAIPAQYEKAWVFSEGVAVVMTNGMLDIIDHDGDVLNERHFPYTERIDDYCFHNDLCIMIDDHGNYGLVNMDGEWFVNPDYRYIEYNDNGFWIVYADKGYRGLLDKNGDVFLPTNYTHLSFHGKYICLGLDDNYSQIVDFEGNMVDSNVIEFLQTIYYTSDEQDEYGDWKIKEANLWAYYTDWSHCGLIDRDGNVLTPPAYHEIKAMAADRYLCDTGLGIEILNDKGEKIGNK